MAESEEEEIKEWTIGYKVFRENEIEESRTGIKVKPGQRKYKKELEEKVRTTTQEGETFEMELENKKIMGEIETIIKKNNETDREKNWAENVKKVKKIHSEGNILFQRKDYENAQKQYEAALSEAVHITQTVSPFDEMISADHTHQLALLCLTLHLNAAACALLLNHPACALSHCRQVLLVSPSLPKACYRAARAHIALRQFSLALPLLQTALAASPSDPSILSSLQLVHRALES